MSFQSIPIRSKLIASFTVLTLFLVGLGLLGLMGAQAIRQQTLEIEGNWLPSVRLLGEIDTAAARSNGVMLRHTQATGLRFALDTHNLPSGFYSLVVVRGTEVLRRHIEISH